MQLHCNYNEKADPDENGGYEVVEKKPEKGGNSARIYVPKRWIGKKVRVILIEQ